MLVRTAATLVAATLVANVPKVLAQAQETRDRTAVNGPRFEAASVRPNNTTGPMRVQWWPNGRFRAVNVPLRMLISIAYNTPSGQQVLGTPGWTSFEKFDVEAVPSGDVPRPQHLLMLRSLLKERFAMVARPQSTEITVYTLVKADPAAALPRGIRESSAKCDTLRESSADQSAQAQRVCSLTANPSTGRIIATGARMAALTFQLTTMLGMKVVDRTGLTGLYDFEVTWPADASAVGNSFADAAAARASLLTAVQEQIGLVLQTGKAPANAVMIERIERPTPN
ncbi:MAG TPA: TIGR03435 family protein [Vicinamibacterales bacterium]|nr:TIGR03435 family protein [Vicinamibacterales bacterium]